MAPEAPPSRLRVTLRRPPDFNWLAERWTAFEARADGSFFQSWAWVGCLGEERWTDPVLIEAHRDEDLVALGLCNHRRGGGLAPNRLWLGETGHPSWDSVFVEHNGFLLARGEHAAVGDCVAAALHRGRRGSALVLNGIASAQWRAARVAGGTCVVEQTRQAPFVDLAHIASLGGRFDRHLSANARSQLRRSARCYAQSGPLRVTRARSAAEAHAFLDAMALLHQATWTARGKPGAFARPEFGRFHHALIDRSDAVDLLRVTAGDNVVGYLHNFRYRGRVYAYQSGFDYAAAASHGSHVKPGLTCHQLAIEQYLHEGMATYDFLAGEDRYKTTLATGSEPLHWVTLGPNWSWPALLARTKRAVRHVLGRQDVYGP